VKKKIIIVALVLVVFGLIVGIIEVTGRFKSEQVKNDPETSEIAGSSQSEEENNLKEENVSEEVLTGEEDSLAWEVTPVDTVKLSEAIKIEDGEKGVFYGNEAFQNVAPVDVSSFSKEDIPSKYDSRNVDGKCYITELEDQGYSYLCWSFATMAAMESDILKHHDSISYEDIDLSEKHLAYYNMHRCTGSLNGYIDDDYRELINAENKDDAWVFDYDTNYIAMGGVTDFCISLLTAWKGPVAEEGTDAFTSIYGDKYLFKDNTEPPSDGYRSDYHVQEVSELIPNRGNMDLVKQLILEHGAVTASVNADNIYWSDHGKNLYSSFGSGEVPPANHEIVIVGWDDDYDAKKFVTDPRENGAWICRNSWGPHSGDGGYFCLSYFDDTTSMNNVAAYSVALKDEKDWYDNNYQVSGFLGNVVSALDDSKNYVTAYSEAKNPYGVLYSASSDELLKAVGFMSLETYRQYQVDIFTDPQKDESGSILVESLKDPACSTLVSNISGGYHTYELSKPVSLDKDEEFFVLVRPVTAGRLVYEQAADNVGEANYDEWNNLTGNVRNNYEASGRSYYIAADGKSMEPQKDKDFFLKAYTNSN
jgi:C1A family cysteine protease